MGNNGETRIIDSVIHTEPGYVKKRNRFRQKYRLCCVLWGCTFIRHYGLDWYDYHSSYFAIGLTTTDTPRTTNPVNVAEFEFIDYEIALRETATQVEAAGADLLVVAGHICRRELESLAGEISDLEIDMLGGGHCNELFANEINDIV
ncbi:MAG: hypothetical protein GY869_22205, partial [Planctomycetes bacterium]|nr:hypothetical protein [Planctomycetota bacterium]